MRNFDICVKADKKEGPVMKANKGVPKHDFDGVNVAGENERDGVIEYEVKQKWDVILRIYCC
jgi:hypothetical protein